MWRLALLLLCVVAGARSGAASDVVVSTAGEVMLPGPVARVVPWSRHLVVSRPGEVLWLDDVGAPVHHRFASQTVPAAPALPDRRAQALDRRRQDEELFDRHGIEPEVREELQGELWLEDMRPRGSNPAQPSALPLTAPPPPLLAANGAHAIAATSSGLYHLEAPGRVRKLRGLDRPPRTLAVSAAGRVLLADERGVFGLHPEGMSAPCPLGGTTGPPAQLVAIDGAVPLGEAPCADVIAVAREGVRLTVHWGAKSHALPWRALGLQACGGTALVNAEEGLFHLEALAKADPPVRARRLGPRAPHEQVVCHGADAASLVSFSNGGGLARSHDRGRSFTAYPGPLGPPLADLAVTDGAVWLATPFGLLRWGPQTPAASPEASAHLRAPRWWQTMLPRVELAATLADTHQAHGPLPHQPRDDAAELWLAAEFPLAPRPAPVPTGRPPRVPPEVDPAPEGPPACLAELRDAAVRLALADPRRLNGLIARARHAAWLPELRFRVEKRLGRNQSADFDDETLYAPLGVRTVNDMRLELRATWDLARAVFSPDELAATVQAARLAETRREIAALVNRLFFERRRRDQALRRPPVADRAAEGPESGLDQARAPDEDVDPELEAELARDAPRRRTRRKGNALEALGAEEASLRIAELDAELDGLTDGLAARCR